MRYTQCLATAAQGMRGANEQASQERRREKKRAGNPDPALDAVFGAYPKPVKTKLLALRRLIFDTAKTVKGVGALEIITDPYRLKKQGMIEVTSFVMVDVAVRYPEAFCKGITLVP